MSGEQPQRNWLKALQGDTSVPRACAHTALDLHVPHFVPATGLWYQTGNGWEEGIILSPPAKELDLFISIYLF